MQTLACMPVRCSTNIANNRETFIELRDYSLLILFFLINIMPLKNVP